MFFLCPGVLWLLAVVPIIGVAAVWLAWVQRQTLLKHFGDEKLWSKFSRPLRSCTYFLKAFFVAAALSLMVVSLARPAYHSGQVEFLRGSVDVVCLVDVSRSMAVTDYQGQVTGPGYGGGTRLDMAKWLLLNDVIPSLNGNQLGVVTFSGEVSPQAFISGDMPALKWVLSKAITVGSAPGQGSVMARAFYLAFALFDLDSSGSHRKIIVLFSDGGNDDGQKLLDSALQECQRRGIEVIVAGLGKDTDSPIPVKELPERDQMDYWHKQYYEVDGRVVTETAIDENTLRLVSNKAAGRYVRVRHASDFHLGTLAWGAEVTREPGDEEIFLYPLALSVVFAVLAVLCPLERDGSQIQHMASGCALWFRRVLNR